MTFDDERFSVNTAWIRKGGIHFEIVVDPDAAIAFRQTRSGDIRDVVKSGHVYFDAKKGELASEHQMQAVFHSSEPYVVAERIIREGEIQLTQEYRDKLREQKRRRLLEIIHRNAIDPKTKLPHPLTRIELAFEEAKVRVDELRSAEDQVQEVLRKLQPVLPIKFEHALLHIHLPVEHAAKLMSSVQSFGSIKRQEWLSDGSWSADIEVPAGLALECIDMLNKKTHGAVQVTQEHVS
jgi:ribosome maturation protein SDO1